MKFCLGVTDITNNYNNLHLYGANLYMNIFGCALQYCYIEFILKVTKAWETIKTTIKSIKNYKKKPTIKAKN